MSGFNTSTRKEDLSVRLRAHNMKQARDQTKRLEEDNKKMEERLRELKTAMNREKEDREKKGGGFWGRGQTKVGSLTSYASDVLQTSQDKTPQDVKKKKIKVLQDEPLDVPKRSNQPGTIKNIAQRKLPSGVTSRSDKLRGGPKCGQCEDRTATLTCVQCSEIFCFGCFSAFHLKGALKQHRSVPLSATGSRVCMSPRSVTESHYSHGDSQASGTIPINSVSLHNESGAAQASPTPPADTSLLNGDYNESQSAASFQQALLAWRQGEQQKVFRSQIFSPHKSNEPPPKAPVMTLDESIGTTEQSRLPEIKFKSTLSYAERLMLKKHRRTELAELSTPRSDGSSHSKFSSTFSAKSGPFGKEAFLYGRRQDSVLEGSDHIDFQSLFEAVKSAETPELQLPSNYSVSPDSSDSSEIIHQQAFKKSVYVVKEVSPLESWKLENNIESETLEKSNTATKNTKSKLTRHTNTNITEMFTPDTDRPVSSMSGDSEIIKSFRHKPKSSKGITSVSSTSDLVKDNRSENLNSAVFLEATEEECSAKPRPRSKMSNSRLGKKSRPASRAESQANSRISLKGHLTGSANEALKKVAQMTNLPQFLHIYYSPMEQFFLAGVKVTDQNQDSVRKQTKEDQNRSKSRTEKVSNRLYQMAPKSWRPDSSLSEMIPLSEIKVDDNSEAMTLAYSYSEAITGKAAEWRPSSSQSRVPPVSPAGDHTGLMFGDEMFTEEAAQVVKTTARVPSAPRSGTQRQRSEHSENTASDSKNKNSSISTRTLHTDKLEKSSRVSPSEISTLQKSKNDLNQSVSVTGKNRQKSSTSKPIEISKSQSIKPANSAIISSRQNSQGVEHSQMNQKSNKDVKTNVRKQPPENIISSDKPLQTSNSGKTQGRSSLVSKSASKPTKNAKNVLNRSESDHRPLSSTNVPQVAQGSSKKTQMRPNSSSGPAEPLRKTQPSLKIKNSATPENTVIADMMMSRVQEDNWVAGQHENDSETDSDILDYDDGDDIGLTLARLGRNQSSLEGNQHWETEIRPFSEVSLVSKGANTPFTEKDNNRAKRPISSRPVSMLSGRESKAIIIDGDDLTSYDNVDVTQQLDMEDKQALDQLEWELASDTGRLTADGQISRMSLNVLNEDNETSKSSSEQDYDFAAQLIEDDRNAEREIDINLTRRSATLDEDEVRALR